MWWWMTNLIVVFAGHSLLTEAIQINTVVAFIPVGSVLKVSEIFRRGQALFSLLTFLFCGF